MARRRNLPERKRPDPLPWERQPGEPIKGFTAFAHFRDLGYHGSLAKVAADLNVGARQLERYSAKWSWIERRDAYLEMWEARMRDEMETERLRLARTHMGATAEVMNLALRRMRGETRETPDGPLRIEALSPEDLDPADVARFLDLGIRWQRVIAGLPTDVIRGTMMVTGADMERVGTVLIRIGEMFCPEERRQRFFATVERYMESGQPPWSAAA